jgi:plastocyanin
MAAMTPRALLLALTLAFALAAPAFAGDLRVAVTDQQGRPVADAVATVRTAGLSGPIRFAWPMEIAQRDMQFEPFVLIAPAGASVAFPNFDDVRHQVYSFSQAGPFELRLYGRDQTRSVQFRNVGVIAIGCNIHDNMSAFIYVVDTPFAMKTGSNGAALLRNVPSGPVTLRIWHPYLRAAGNMIERQIVLPAGDSAQEIEVRLRAPPDHGHDY